MIDWPAFLDPTWRLHFWTILIGIISNVTCSLLGCFLVLRKMSMLGDALSHAVLPGLVIAFLLTKSMAPVPLFLGAIIFAMLTAGLSKLVASHGQASEESGLGIVFTSFFALGIVLVQWNADGIHLDRDVVLEGAIDYVVLDQITLFGIKWPVALWTTSTILITVIVWLWFFWKEIKAAVFDPDYAAAIGLLGHTMLATLIIMVAISVVGSFKIVGSILVVAMLIVPAASAQLLCHQLKSMLWTSAAFACGCTVLGYMIAWQLNTSTAGMMACVCGVAYLLALIFSPQNGLLITFLERKRLHQRILEEDILGILYRCEEQHTDQTPSQGMSLAEIANIQQLAPQRIPISRLLNAEMVQQVSDSLFRLTERGRLIGQGVVRGHRLWESFLESEFQLPEDHLHEAAHHIEHYLDRESRERLEQELGSPSADPHGRNIPPKVPGNDT